MTNFGGRRTVEGGGCVDGSNGEDSRDEGRRLRTGARVVVKSERVLGTKVQNKNKKKLVLGTISRGLK